MYSVSEVINFKKPKIVAIDNGFVGTKIYYNEKSYYLGSKYEKSNDTTNKKNTHHLVYNGVDYIVGEGASISSIDYDKTSNEMYQIITYAGLSMISNLIDTDFYLIGSYPLKIYNQSKDSFSKYLKGSGEFQTKFNGELKKFNILNAITFPQGISHAYNHPDLFIGQMRGVLDWGGLTINGVILNDFNTVPNTSFTENLGSIILYNEIKKNLDTKFNQNIQPYEIPTIIKQGLKIKGQLQEESIIIIKNTIDEHMNKIKNVMKSNNWNIDSLELFITGGSSLDFKSQLEFVFPHAIFSEDPINDGAKGLFKVGQLMYNC